MKKQSGFTLIELIIVIVILGILAVTAAPQFFNFGADARTSTVRGMEGSVKAAADLVYARAAIQGSERDPAAADNTVNTGRDGQGDEVAIAFGYPTAAALANALNVSDGDWTFSPDTPTTSVTITPEGIDAVEEPSESTGCQVVYTQAANPGERPTIVTSVGGC